MSWNLAEARYDEIRSVVADLIEDWGISPTHSPFGNFFVGWAFVFFAILNCQSSFGRR